MQNSRTILKILTLGLVVIVAGTVWHWLHRRAVPTAATPAASHFQYTASAPRLSNPGAAPTAEPARDAAGLPMLARDKVEGWLARHDRNAASLLAAFRALGDTNYLNEAATNFSNDPRVELAILSRDAFPGDRRKWLDAFEKSSPDNSLANYLSAADDFKNGQAEDALQELAAASGKSGFENYAADILLDDRELYLDSGQSLNEADIRAIASMSEEDIPEISTLKQLDISLADLMKQRINSGDPDSAVDLAQMGFALADKLSSGNGGKLIINQLVGSATEAYMLNQLDQSTAYDFLNGQTPAQVLQQLKQNKADFRELSINFQNIYPSLTPAEQDNYYSRFLIYGEAAAMRWVIQQRPTGATGQ